jgi:hypothetical protein
MDTSVRSCDKVVLEPIKSENEQVNSEKMFYLRLVKRPAAACTHPPEITMTTHKNIKCPEGVIGGSFITKEKRQEMFGKIDGGKGSKKPEEYQRTQIELGTGCRCNITKTRINKRTKYMIDLSHPMTKNDGFDYTENFDGIQVFHPYTVLYNFKSVVGKGGSQTRTLRDECYPFVEAQLNYLLKTKKTDCFFANIFDGDEAAATMYKFMYLIELPEYSTVKKYVYVGDLKSCFEWLSVNVC